MSMRGPRQAMGCGVRATGLMVLILGCFAAAHGQETAVTLEASAALRHFLSVDCEVGAEGTARRVSRV